MKWKQIKHVRDILLKHIAPFLDENKMYLIDIISCINNDYLTQGEAYLLNTSGQH